MLPPPLSSPAGLHEDARREFIILRFDNPEVEGRSLFWLQVRSAARSIAATVVNSASHF